MKIVNFAGGKPSDGSSLPSPVLVEELQVLVLVMVMVMAVFKMFKMFMMVVIIMACFRF